MQLSMKRFSNSLVVASLLCCLLTVSSCHKKHHRTTSIPNAPHARKQAGKPPAVPIGYTEQGIASWYGIPYHGRPAANGEIYNMETLVAAHRVLPFNTWLRVTNLSNDKSVDVRVIDRGPFVHNRIIDLSKAAARQIDLLGPGIGKVRLQVISAPADVPANDCYGVQVGAFSVLANAERARSDYARRFGAAQIELKQGRVPLWRVIAGSEPSEEAAGKLAQRMSADGKSVFVVRIDKGNSFQRSTGAARH